ncbi:MAG TPA: NAD(P)-dependent oxidoreductase, partial [Burkholderiales bacterium]|nr:NAD(P)-dependent oxidoreductase [Burkholderiales bacterium]
MGQPMAANLAKEGFAVRSFDLNGTGSSPSVRDAAAGAEVMITMLPDGEAVRKAVLEALPALDSGTVVVDMSSSDPAATRALGTVLAARGIELVDAPVSGAVPKAIDGTLTIMAGGNAATLKRITPLLEKMGDRVFHVGPLGAGHAVKALNNYVGAAGTLAGFEALLIARAYGLDPKPMLEAINASTGRNSTTERKIPQQVLTGAFASGFRLALMVKDVGIAYRLARDLGIDAPYLREALKLWRDAERHLPADADHTRAYEYLKRRSAPARRKPAPSRGARARRSSPRRSPRRST